MFIFFNWIIHWFEVGGTGGGGMGGGLEVKFWERSIILSLTENYVKIDADSTIRMEDA